MHGYLLKCLHMGANTGGKQINSAPFIQSIKKVIKMKDVWILGITLLGYQACFQGIMGYIPSDFLEISDGLPIVPI